MITIQPEIKILSTESYEDMLRRIEKIGRVCYKSEERIGEGTAEKFIAGIIKRGHESVIEHGSITVKVTCDRGVTHPPPYRKLQPGEHPLLQLFER